MQKSMWIPVSLDSFLGVLQVRWLLLRGKAVGIDEEKGGR